MTLTSSKGTDLDSVSMFLITNLRRTVKLGMIYQRVKAEWCHLLLFILNRQHFPVCVFEQAYDSTEGGRLMLYLTIIKQLLCCGAVFLFSDCVF